MTTNKQPSLVFDVWVASYELLRAAAWPELDPETQVLFGDVLEPEQLSEVVVLTGFPKTNPTQSRVTFGSSSSKDDRFAFMIVVATRIPGKTRWDALARMKELCGVVQTTFRSPSSGRPEGGLSATVPGVISWEIAGFSDLQVPALDVEGFRGYAELILEFHTRL